MPHHGNNKDTGKKIYFWFNNENEWQQEEEKEGRRAQFGGREGGVGHL